jgi:GNAT superfamily N-acetyltransferase
MADSPFKTILPNCFGANIFLFKYNNTNLKEFLRFHKTELGFIRNSLIHQSPEIYDFEPKGKNNFIIFMIKSNALIGCITAHKGTKTNWIDFLWCHTEKRRLGIGSFLLNKIESMIQNECDISHDTLCYIHVLVIPSACKFYEKKDYIFIRMLPLNSYNVVNSIYSKELC